MTKLQGRDLLLSQQDLIISSLIKALQHSTKATLSTSASAVAPLDIDDNYDSDDDDDVDDSVGNSIDSNGNAAITIGKWCISLKHIREYIGECPSSINDFFTALSATCKRRLVRQVGRFITSTLSGISGVCALRDASNNVDPNDLPDVLPHQLCKLSVRNFGKRYKQFLQRYGTICREEFIDRVEIEVFELHHWYNTDNSTMTTIDRHSDATPFNVAWKELKRVYPSLCNFAGSLATIFANSATVESDFSRLKRIKDPHRQSLTDLSLEGIMQAENYNQLFHMGGIQI